MSRLRILIALITHLVLFSDWTWSRSLWIIRCCTCLGITFYSRCHTFGGRERGDDLYIFFYSRVSRRNQLGGCLVFAQFEGSPLFFLSYHHLVWLKSCWWHKRKFLSCQKLLRIGLFNVSLQSSILVSGSARRDTDVRTEILQLRCRPTELGCIGCLAWRFGFV